MIELISQITAWKVHFQKTFNGVLEFFWDINYAPKKETVYPNVSITKQELQTRYNEWINEEKIIAAFKGFESKKSSGPDGLKPITLKHLPQSMITSIKMIYKASIALHFTPTKWKS